MGNSLRGCLACVCPFGPLDVIRVVHSNGKIEVILRPISAMEVLEANPNHVLTKPCVEGAARYNILFISPESDLKSGNIYFLIPASSAPPEKKKKKSNTTTTSTNNNNNKSNNKPTATTTTTNDVQECNNYLREIPTEKKSSCRVRRSGRVCVWRHHLESISEGS